jgi:hypothetical protein
MTSLDRNPFHRSSTPLPLSARAVPRRFSARRTSLAPSVSENPVPLIQSWTDRVKRTVWDRVSGWAKRRLDDWVHHRLDQLLPEPGHLPLAVNTDRVEGLSALPSPPPPPPSKRQRRSLAPAPAIDVASPTSVVGAPEEPCSSSSYPPAVVPRARKHVSSRLPRARAATNTGD